MKRWAALRTKATIRPEQRAAYQALTREDNMGVEITHNGDHLALDYTKQGRRPSVVQIVGEWHTQGKPDCFEVEYGETFALFQRVRGQRSIFGGGSPYRWHDSGNGCEGVKRDQVIKALNALEEERG